MGKAVYYSAAGVVGLLGLGWALLSTKTPEVCLQAERAREKLASPEYLRPDLDAPLQPGTQAVAAQAKGNLAAMVQARLDAQCREALEE
jgi:hypothetical protein